MDWKIETGHVKRALEAVFDPVWRFHWWLGPLSVLLSMVFAAFVGFLTTSPAWGVVVLLGLLLALTFTDVVRRERQAYRHAHGEVDVLGFLYDEGEMILSALEVYDTFLRRAETEEARFEARKDSVDSLQRAQEWINTAESEIRAKVGDQAARLFRIHPNVTLPKSPPPDLSDYLRPYWEDIEYRLAWLVLRLAALDGPQRSAGPAHHKM